MFAVDGGSDADTVNDCNLQRGLRHCASEGTAPNPQAPEGGDGKGEFSGNFAGGNHDTDGTVTLAIGNQLFVIDRRCADESKRAAKKRGQQRVRVELGGWRRHADRTRHDCFRPAYGPRVVAVLWRWYTKAAAGSQQLGSCAEAAAQGAPRSCT